MDRPQSFLITAIAVVPLSGWSAAAQAGGKHAGYYYPPPESTEVYTARAKILPEANRKLRIGFVTGITNQLAALPYAPTAAIFAKGEHAEKLIIVALEDGRIDTLYRARAIFANLTAAARVMPLFEERGVEDWFTFFDLAKMLGFEKVTISDGRDFAHQVTFE